MDNENKTRSLREKLERLLTHCSLVLFVELCSFFFAQLSLLCSQYVQSLLLQLDIGYVDYNNYRAIDHARRALGVCLLKQSLDSI